MEKYKLPYFGSININSIEANKTKIIELDEEQIDIELNFSKKIISRSLVLEIINFLKQLHKINKSNKIAIFSDFENKGEAYDYIQFHTEELNFENSKESEVNMQNNENFKKSLLDKVILHMICLYPEDKNRFCVFDYHLKEKNGFSNQILVVINDFKGNLVEVTWES